MKISRRKFLKGAAIGTAAAAGVGFWQLGEVDRLRVRHQALTLPRWDAHGLRVALLTDLHVDQDAAEALALRAIELAAQEKPDLILVVGDTISRHYKKTPQHITTVMGRLRDTGIPAYQVLGNHEYWNFRPDEVVAYLQASPVPLLRNELQEIEGINLWGVDDALMNRWRPDSLPRKYDRNVLAMLHEPDPSEDLQGAPSLVVSGHSHGGQVCLPGQISFHTPKGARQYIRGFYPSAPNPLFVSCGVGTVGPRVRAFCPPEINILTLNG